MPTCRFQQDCIIQWKKQCRKDHKPIVCPNCRADWVDEVAKKVSRGGVEYNEEDGYVNLGRLQGMPEERGKISSLTGLVKMFGLH